MPEGKQVEVKGDPWRIFDNFANNYFIIFFSALGKASVGPILVLTRPRSRPSRPVEPQTPQSMTLPSTVQL